MATRASPINVGAPDPELKNSPILEDTAGEPEPWPQSGEGAAVCYFNGSAYDHGAFICTGRSELLRCEDGAWVREGNCYPESP